MKISHVQTTYNDLIVIHGPMSVLYALSLTGWHFAMTFRKPIFVIGKKKVNVELIQLIESQFKPRWMLCQ